MASPYHRRMNESKANSTPVVAYQSSKGPILTSGREGLMMIKLSKLRLQVLSYMGQESGRNSNGYLYAGMSTAELQNKYHSNEILVIVPRFLVPEDGVFVYQ
uniref:Uncharacterized protein n=1 Tax=Chaetoceros debilis TaxID=122233 RepID=A0A7S3V857_9STRA|mmetsp:Transcript_23512/g.35723  ORF Transcript_23512/g.35723 Transcript_23512/m.35723 type:complete len:102 (-) Transcript_23512:185-490(-)